MTSKDKHGAEKARHYREQRKTKDREIKLKTYNKNKVLYNERRRENRRKNSVERNVSNEAKRKREYRFRKMSERDEMERRRIERNRKKREYREKAKRRSNDANQNGLRQIFHSRTQKHRALKKMKESLPATPKKRAAIISAYMATKSPTAKMLQKLKTPSPEDIKKMKTADALLADLKTVVDKNKMKRSDDARATINVLTAAINGENIEENKCKTHVSRKLGFTVRRMASGKRIRNKVLRTEQSALTYTSRKTRSDALPNETKKLVYEFWISSENSRPTANKNDIKRVRIGPNSYSSHMKYILEKTQTEVFLSFKEKYPEIKISQRLFEKLKPYFLVPVRPRDRETCCCRYHVEARSLFKTCMEFRKSNLPNIATDLYPVFNNLSELVDFTLCKRPEGEDFHKLQCIERKCEKCGVNMFKLSEEELEMANGPDLKWMRYEYVDMKIKKITKRKLCLVQKNTKPGEMFAYFVDILSKFASHVFRSKWQSLQLKSLKENLPNNHVICIHDFSENYLCKERVEIQSSYFQKPEASLHVTVMYRHHIQDIDGPERQESGLVEEQFFVISPDSTHDHNFTHEVQKQICNYLKTINYQTCIMHEFTDGCASQYKSRNCFGDLSYANHDFGYSIIRNFFETSHAKGVQDAAGGLIKHQADMAITRGKCIIQNAANLHDFCVKNLCSPKDGSSGCKRRIFRYIEEIPRDRDRIFCPIPSVRCLHQVKSTDNCKIQARNLSCYSCHNCFSEHYHLCSSSAGPFHEYVMKHSGPNTDEVPEKSTAQPEMIQKGVIVAVFTDDPGEDYYLVQCLDEEVLLDRPEKDDWGNEFPNGSSVIRGLYFEKNDIDPLTFKLIKKKQVLVPSLSVRFCLANKLRYGKFTITEELHEDILKSCDI